ncbi:MAG: hypothetical protein ABJB22_02160, partial [Verrucomicrobiota bacterium]
MGFAQPEMAFARSEMGFASSKTTLAPPEMRPARSKMGFARSETALAERREVVATIQTAVIQALTVLPRMSPVLRSCRHADGPSMMGKMKLSLSTVLTLLVLPAIFRMFHRKEVA